MKRSRSNRERHAVFLAQRYTYILGVWPCRHEPRCYDVARHKVRCGLLACDDDWDPICDCGEPAYACRCNYPNGPGGGTPGMSHAMNRPPGVE